MRSVLANHDGLSGHGRSKATTKAPSGHQIAATRESELERRPRPGRVLSITGMTLASAIAVGGVQAQSNDQCETVIGGPLGGACIDRMRVTPFFSPPEDRSRVPFYQPSDPRDYLFDQEGDGGNGDAPPPEDEDDDDDICTSTVFEKDLIFLSETEAFLSSESAFTNYVGALTGGVVGAVFGSLVSDDTASGTIGAIIGASITSWLAHVLGVGENIHCGDRLITETTVCLLPNQPLAPGVGPIVVRAVDTTTEHRHDRCIDDYMNPPGGGGGGGGGGGSPDPDPDLRLQSKPPELRFSFTLNGVTHSFEDEPSMKELQSIKREIRKQRVPKGNFDDFVDEIITGDAFKIGIQAGIHSYESYFDNQPEPEGK